MTDFGVDLLGLAAVMWTVSQAQQAAAHRKDDGKAAALWLIFWALLAAFVVRFFRIY
jgi:hypothetical protein